MSYALGNIVSYSLGNIVSYALGNIVSYALGNIVSYALGKYETFQALMRKNFLQKFISFFFFHQWFVFLGVKE